MKLDKKKISKILIIQPRGLGDVVLSTVIPYNLRKDFPDAKIDYLVQRPNNAALEKLTFLDDIISYDRKNHRSMFAAVLSLRRRKYDLVIDLYCNPRTALAALLSGARWRAGYSLKGRGFVYNLKCPERTAQILHQVQRHIRFLKHLGMSHDTTDVFFGFGEEDIRFADDFFARTFSSGDFVVGISPSGNWPARKCDPVKLAEIGGSIVDTYGAKILFIWGPSEKDEVSEIRSLMKNTAFQTPPTDIRQMGAIISRCSLLISNNSSPMHISTAVGTPVLSIEGPINPLTQGPFGEAHESVRLEELACIGCHFRVCPKNHECFLHLPVDRVMEKISLIIEKNNITVQNC